VHRIDGVELDVHNASGEVGRRPAKQARARDKGDSKGNDRKPKESSHSAAV
jgi:hypothetical protein